MPVQYPASPHCQLGAWEAAQKLSRRELSAVALTQACLDRIEEREPQLQAFVTLGRESALARARALDAGPVQGLLHGLPLGVKDLLDTHDLPTRYGSPIFSQHQPPSDAAAVALCREAGAVVLGKTVSTELAYFQPGPTRNPHHLEHTPGGSSSGSAAAVADFLLPLALGTQTAGSIIRPAAFCGVVGYKPSLGRVPRAGCKSLSDSLDTVGGFGRSVRDVALLGAALTGDTTLIDWTPTAPRIGLYQGSDWARADSDIHSAWQHALSALAPTALVCADVAPLPGMGGLVPLQKSVMAFEMARWLSDERLRHRAQLSPPMLALMEQGMAISGQTHMENLIEVRAWRQRIDGLFNDHDVLLTPSAMGQAPHGLQATGDPLFCRGWTLLGLPCIHLPFARGHLGLPVGLQVVGRYGHDRQLMAAAQWMHQRLLG